VIQQNIDYNTPGSKSVYFKGYKYTWFLELVERSTTELQEQKENKKMLKEQQKHSSNFVPFNSDQNNNNNNNNGDGDGYGNSDGDGDGNSDGSDDDNDVPGKWSCS
jgi:hypothetical protein